MPFMWKIGGFTLAAVLVGSIVFAGYRHYQGLLAENKALEKENIMLTQAVNGYETRETNMTKQMDSANERTMEAQRILTEAVKRLDASRELFAKHDFGALLAAKPGLIEKMMGRATKRIFVKIEEAAVDPE